MSCREAVVCAALVWSSLPGPLPGAQATVPGDDLSQGIREYDEGAYDQAVLSLDAAVSRLKAVAGRPGELERAYIYLGASLVALGNDERATASFRAAIPLMVVQAGGKRMKIKDLNLAPYGFSPKVTSRFEAAKREARAEAGEKDSKGPRLPLILAGIGIAAGGSVALATASHAPGASASPSPTPNPFQVALLSSNPPQGSTLSLAENPFLTVELSVSYGQSGTYELWVSFWDMDCVGTGTQPFSLTADQAQTVRVELGQRWSCSVAGSTHIDRMTVGFYVNAVARDNQLAFVVLPVDYTLVP